MIASNQSEYVYGAEEFALIGERTKTKYRHFGFDVYIKGENCTLWNFNSTGQSISLFLAKIGEKSS